MDLLFLTPYLPSPPRWGGPRRLHGLMRGLAEGHNVSVLSFVAPRGPEATFVESSLAATREYCAEVVTVANPRYGLGTRAKRALQLRSLASPRSYERLVYHQPAFQAALDGILRRRRFDAITVEFAQMAPFRFPRATTLVLDEHNIEYDILRRTSAAERGGARKLYNALNYHKLRREEQRAWRRVDGCSLTSARDEALLRRHAPALRTAVVPNAADTDAFRPATTAPEPRTVVFFGAIDYYPNTDGLLFFLGEVLPILRARVPGVRVLIVGPSPPEAIARFASETVTITGFVDDIQPYLARAGVAIVPLRVGGGTRLKIVEAMALGKAIVSTTIGAEGLAVTDGEHLLLADTAADFAGQIGRLFEDAALARRLGAAARALAEREYSWRGSVRKLERFYREVLASAPNRRPDHRAGATPRTTAGSWR